MSYTYVFGCGPALCTYPSCPLFSSSALPCLPWLLILRGFWGRDMRGDPSSAQSPEYFPCDNGTDRMTGWPRPCWRSWTRSRIAASGTTIWMSAAQKGNTFCLLWMPFWDIFGCHFVDSVDSVVLKAKLISDWYQFDVFFANIFTTFAWALAEVPVDLSNILFLSTANVLDTIPGPLLVAWCIFEKFEWPLDLKSLVWNSSRDLLVYRG